MIISLALLFTACKYGHTEHSFKYTEIAAQEDVFVPLPASLVDETNSVGLVNFITLYGLYPFLVLLALKWGGEIDWCHNLGDELQFLVYDLETAAVSDISTMRVEKSLRVGGEVMLNFPGRKTPCLKVTSYASIESCGLQ